MIIAYCEIICKLISFYKLDGRLIIAHFIFISLCFMVMI